MATTCVGKLAALRYLADGVKQIASLYSHVLAAEKQQSEINDALSHIEQQQRDLASTLDAYEKISQEILGGQGSTLRALDTGPADNERDKKSVFCFHFLLPLIHILQLHARN